MIHSSIWRIISVFPCLALWFSLSAAAVPPEQNSYLWFSEAPRIQGSILLSRDQGIQLAGDFTIELAVYINQLGEAQFIKREVDGDPFMHYVLLTDFEGKPEFWQSTGGTASLVQVKGVTPLPIKTWVHLAGVSEAGVLKLYVDGVLAAQQGSPGSPANNAQEDLILGHFFNGSIAQARLWSRALPDSELLQTGGSAVDPETALGLIAYWPLDDGESPLARDLGPLQSPLMLGNSGQIDDSSPRWVPRAEFNLGESFQCTPYASEPATWGFVIDFDNNDDLDYLRVGAIGEQEDLLPEPPYYTPPALVPMTAYRNDGSGILTDASADILGDQDIQIVAPRRFIVADFNNDLRDDVFVADHGPDPLPEPCPDEWCFPGGLSRLLLQTPTGMENVTATHLPQIYSFIHSTAAGDIDNDEDLDIYIGMGGSDGPANTCMTADPIPADAECTGFYVNDGAGNFTQDLTRLPEAYTRLMQGGLSATMFDVNNDEYVDLVIDRNVLLNDQTGHFSEGQRLPPRPYALETVTVKIDHADLNDDGFNDILLWHIRLGDLASEIQLLINNQDGTFDDESANIPRYNEGVGFAEGFAFGDYNADGFTDIAFESLDGGRVLLNKGDATFVETAAMSDFHFLGDSTAADFNNDELDDLLIDLSDKGIVVCLNTGALSNFLFPTILIDSFE